MLRRLLVVLVLMAPGLALADSTGCPILFQPGIGIGQAARHCSAEGGLLVRQGAKWACLDKQWRTSTIFAFEVLPQFPKILGTVYFYPQSHSTDHAATLNHVLDELTECTGSEPAVLVVEPHGASSGLLFRWTLKDGTQITAQELNRTYDTIMVEVTPTTQATSR